MKENPQDLPKGTSDDSSSFLGEAQKDIHPLNQFSQEKEDYCSYIQGNIKMPPFFTKEEIDQYINIQSASVYLSHDINYHIAKNGFIDKFKEKKI